MTKEWVSLCLSRAIEGLDATVLSELGCLMEPMTLRTAASWYQEPHSGGLGWSFPCALGMQLARPGRLIVATMGDGSYMFSNPVACHQIAEALELPVLVLVLNNREWGAVRKSVLGTYPDGYASRENRMPLVSLDPSPDFSLVAQGEPCLDRAGGSGRRTAGVAGSRHPACLDHTNPGIGGNTRRAMTLCAAAVYPARIRQPAAGWQREQPQRPPQHWVCRSAHRPSSLRSARQLRPWSE